MGKRMRKVDKKGPIRFRLDEPNDFLGVPLRQRRLIDRSFNDSFLINQW